MGNPIQRILLVYITKVSGHRQATVAIQSSLQAKAPAAQVMSVNGFGYTYPILEKIVNRAYMGIIKSTPKVWDYLYDNPKVFKKSQGIKEFLHKTSHKKLEKLFSEFPPDAVICTQAFPCGMIADYKRSQKLNIKLIGVLTDYAPHSYWINEGVDFYVVPSEDTRNRLIKKGVDPHRIRLFGIPIHTKFSRPLDKHEINRRLGLNPDVPTILIMGGGQGLGPIKDVVKSLIKIKKDVQLIITAGTNVKLNKWLQKLPRKTSKKIITYQHADNVEELMEVSSLIITKPGGMTTTECLVKGLPMVIVNPIPGQEMRNTDFLLQHGIGIRIDKTADIGEEIELLLNSPERLKAMREAALANARPNAASEIARLVLDV